MRTKLLLFAPVLALALVLTACGPAAAQLRTLAVNGTGMVTLAPDIAYVYIGVHTESTDISQAVNDNNAQAQSVVEALRNSGVDAKDIQTSNFSVYSNPKTDYATGQSAGTTYVVDNTVYVTVRDLTKLGSLLNTAIKSGANNINSISFDVTDKTAAMAQARQKAFDNASSLAKELARTAGLSLGSIQTIAYSENAPGPYSSYGLGGGGGSPAASAPAPINPGQLQLTASALWPRTNGRLAPNARPSVRPC